MEEINDAEIEDQILPDEPAEKKEAEDEEVIPVTSETLPLTAELISQNLSLIARTAVGLSHAYTRLEVHEKEITNLNAIAGFPHLRYIDCSDNNLVNIEGLSSLEFLLSLNLQSNFISNLPATIDKFKYLQHVNLAKNKLKDFTVTSWPMLSFLNLNDNKLTENAAFEDFPEMLHLELRGNRMKTNPKLNLPKLQRLYLVINADNPIEQVDNYRLEVLNRLSKLDRLDKEQVVQEEREEAAIYNPKPIEHQ
ncbi:Leucine-rich repeat-containing protein 23 [Terramyces sp. JEL0728]|nr:Leucine-rich repeat-containing protein 23 [Terramyces sp. JEL0728]